MKFKALFSYLLITISIPKGHGFPTSIRLFAADGTDAFEGDMSLRGLSQSEFLDKISVKEQPEEKPKVGLSLRWPGGYIPYVFGERTSPKLRESWAKAVRYLEDNTCIKLRSRKPEDSVFVTVNSDTARCGLSDVGKLTNGQNLIQIGQSCDQLIIEIIHEIMHTLGFVHEQSRPDRDQFITIETDNLRPFAAINFQKYIPVEINVYNQPYDYYSIMHYPKNAFSRDEDHLATILPKTPGIPIGQTKFVSKRDLNRINLHYDCPQKDEPKAYDCPADSPFYCLHVDGCVGLDKVCDGQNDCGDNSDEMHCGNPKNLPDCPKGWIKTVEGCYKYIGLVDYETAHDACRIQNISAHIPSIRNPETLGWLITALDVDQDDSYIYISGRTHDAIAYPVRDDILEDTVCDVRYFLTFAPYQPSGPSYKPCLALKYAPYNEPNYPAYSIECEIKQQPTFCHIPSISVCTNEDGSIRKYEFTVEQQIDYDNLRVLNCATCICEAQESCERIDECVEHSGVEVCGSYEISHSYWMECTNSNSTSIDQWKSCSTDLDCAFSCVKNYTLSYRQSCAGNQFLDCETLSRIHVGGPMGCRRIETFEYWLKVQSCMEKHNFHQFFYNEKMAKFGNGSSRSNLRASNF